MAANAKPFLSPIDLNTNEVLNARLHQTAVAPDDAQHIPGVFWFDPTIGKFVYRGNADEVIDPTDRATHTGLQGADTIADLHDAVTQYPVSDFAPADKPIDFGGQPAIGLANAYGDDLTAAVNFKTLLSVGMLSKFKVNVEFAITQPVPSAVLVNGASGPQSVINGQLVDAPGGGSGNLQDGRPVLLVSQPDHVENGVWKYVEGGAWTRLLGPSLLSITSGEIVWGVADKSMWQLTSPVGVGGLNEAVTPTEWRRVDQTARDYTDERVQALTTSVEGRTLSDFGAPTGPLSIGSQRLTNVGAPTASTDAATKAYTDAQTQAARDYTDTRVDNVSARSLSDFAAPSADLSIGNHKLTNVSDPTAPTDAATKQYTDAAVAGIGTRSVSDFAAATSDIDAGGHKVVHVATPTANDDASNKGYVDQQVAAVQAAPLSSFGAPTGPLNIGNQRLTNVGQPQAASDGVNLGYVQGLLSGIDWKGSVRAATTEPITLSGLQTVDGVQLADGQRVLVKNQGGAGDNPPPHADNGIYYVRAGAWERTEDASGDKLTAGTTTTVTEGADNKNSVYRLINADAITVGTTLLQFTEIGQLISYAADDGVKLEGNTFKADYAKVSRHVEFPQLGDGVSSSLVLPHNLGKRGVLVNVWFASTGQEVDVDVVRTDVNTVTLNFAVAPSNNQLAALVVG